MICPRSKNLFHEFVPKVMPTLGCLKLLGTHIFQDPVLISRVKWLLEQIMLLSSRPEASMERCHACCDQAMMFGQAFLEVWESVVEMSGPVQKEACVNQQQPNVRNFHQVNNGY